MAERWSLSGAAPSTHTKQQRLNRAVVLSAFANVSDALAALVHDAQALEAASSAADNARQIADQAAARLQLGAVPVSAVHLSGQHWHTARLDEIRYISARLTDTAALFQAMGSTPDEVEARDAPVEIASPAK
jgi:outer membrane protein TolC